MRVKLDIPITIEEICKIADAQVSSKNDLKNKIEYVCTDTRECEANDLFIALEGVNQSGESYVDDAINKKCFVLSVQERSDVITVNNTTEALLKISELYKSKLNLKYTIAVTGSVGKSTTVKFLSKILASKYKVHSPIGNFNNQLGVPLTILNVPRDTEVLVTELGMNHSNEISRLSKCLKPDVGIITLIGSSHIGNLGSRESIAKAKLEITHGMKDGVLLLPYGEPLLAGMSNALFVSYGSSLSNFSLSNGRNGLYNLISPYGNVNGISFFGDHEHLLSNLAFAISAAQVIGLTELEIIKGVKTITESDLRQRFILLKDFTVFDDSYNASPESILADLRYIASFGKPFSAFLGDVLELGDSSKSIHEGIGRAAAEFNINNLYLYGKYSEDTAQGAIDAGIEPSRVFINTDISSPDISIKQIKDNHAGGEIILFKASHKLRLDKIADRLAEEERMNNER